jgi:hypothetical protein
VCLLRGTSWIFICNWVKFRTQRVFTNEWAITRKTVRKAQHRILTAAVRRVRHSEGPPDTLTVMTYLNWSDGKSVICLIRCSSQLVYRYTHVIVWSVACRYIRGLYLSNVRLLYWNFGISKKSAVVKSLLKNFSPHEYNLVYSSDHISCKLLARAWTGKLARGEALQSYL